MPLLLVALVATMVIVMVRARNKRRQQLEFYERATQQSMLNGEEWSTDLVEGGGKSNGGLDACEMDDVDLLVVGHGGRKNATGGGVGGKGRDWLQTPLRPLGVEAGKGSGVSGGKGIY